MRVLLIGHTCSPQHGSEPGVTWNWAWHLSEENEVWLITHWRFRDELTDFLRLNPRPTLHIRFVDVPAAIDPLDREGRRTGGLKLHYILWLREAFRVARRLVSEMSFDVVHQVGWTTIGAPSPFWKLGRPFIWGPLGGGQKVPAQFKYLMRSARVAECVREANIALLPFRPAFRKAVQRSSRVFAVNSETVAVIRRAGQPAVELFLDCGVTADTLQTPTRGSRSGEHLTVLWGGTIQPRKALPLAIQAMANLAHSSKAKLVIAGDGPCRAACQSLCERLGVSNRTDFLGAVSLSRMSQCMASADVFLFTSVRDTFGSVVLEAAAHKLAIIALNHHGITSCLPDDAGIKVPVEDPESTVQSLANAITKLERDPNLRGRLGAAAYNFACLNTWRERAKIMTGVYAQVLAEVHSSRPLLELS